jgi:hypothetical protein
METVDHDDTFFWEEWPQYLQEEILTCLSAQYLCRFRGTCHQWNNLCSSANFITREWAKAPPNRKPCLVLCNTGSAEMPWMTYCFFTKTWNTFISLSFLLKKEENGIYRLPDDWPDYNIGCEGSAAGLFLVHVFPDTHVANFNTVCNPLTQTALKLPAMSSIRNIRQRGIMSGDDHSKKESYIVVALGNPDPYLPGNGMIVEIYNSSEKSWRVAGQLPRDLMFMPGRMVFCAGNFYIIICIHQQVSVMRFCIKEGTFIFIPLPRVANGRMRPHLVTCGSRILIAGEILGAQEELSDEEEVLREVIVWELKEEARWEEIATMPPSIVEDFRRTSPVRLLKCVGVGEFVCFRGGLEILVYDLTNTSWSWLPRCPVDITDVLGFSYKHLMTMSFDPRPHMDTK